jgi:hypothetical protein
MPTADEKISPANEVAAARRAIFLKRWDCQTSVSALPSGLTPAPFRQCAGGFVGGLHMPVTGVDPAQRDERAYLSEQCLERGRLRRGMVEAPLLFVLPPALLVKFTLQKTKMVRLHLICLRKAAHSYVGLVLHSSKMGEREVRRLRS